MEEISAILEGIRSPAKSSESGTGATAEATTVSGRLESPRWKIKSRPFIDDRRILNALLRTLTSKMTITASDLDTVMDVTIQKIAEAVHAEAVMVFLVKQNGWISYQNVYYAPSLFGDDPRRKAYFEDRVAKLGDRLVAPGQGFVGKVVESGSSQVITELDFSEDYFRKLQGIYGLPVRSMVTAPIMADRAIGALRILNKAPEFGGHFNEDDVELLEEVADYSGKAIYKAINPTYEFSNAEMAQYVAKLTNCEFLDLPLDMILDPELIQLVGAEAIRRYEVLPIRRTGARAVSIAMSNPLDVERKDDFQFKTRFAIDRILVSSAEAIASVLRNTFDEPAQKARDAEDAIRETARLVGAEESQADAQALEEQVTEEGSPIVKLSADIIESAFHQGASDIHIEPFEEEVLIRYRVDGELQEASRLPCRAARPLAARYKIMSRLNIAEKRLPQDGRIRFKDFNRKGIDVDLRLSTAPVLFGEKIVMRLLNKASSLPRLDGMGFSESNLELYRKMIAKPYGMILHVGPTGSGKTTTLYAAVAEINTPDSNIQTAEDPVEYILKGVNQVQMHRDIGLTFSSALRAFLRQDPDAILVGEIRDRETAEIAVEAALTGHMLFSTMHTNDAAGTVARLLEMGIEPFLVSGALLCVCAQRLMRRLCPHCRQPYAASAEDLKVLGEPPEASVRLFRPVGCHACQHRGYKGRVGTHELLVASAEVRELINRRAPTEAIKAAAERNGMVSLYRDAISKVKAGVTSLPEALSIVRDD